MSNSVAAAFRALSRPGDGFPSPWLDVASTAMPVHMRDVLMWCQYIWMNSSTYRRSQERVISYFLTEVEIGALRPNKSLGEDEKEKYELLFSETLSMPSAIWEMQINRACYGNSFCTMHVPFRRHLTCPKCGSTVPLKVIAENSRFGFKFSNFEFHATCPGRCKVGSGYSGKWQVTDLPDQLEKNIRIKVWNPHEIEIRHDLLSGYNEYIWRIPADYKNQIRKGNLFELERCPLPVMRAIQHNQLFKFHPGVMYHMKEPTLAGICNRGWGIPRIITNFRDIWYVQVLRRYNEAIALDYVVPFRLITPEPRGGTGMGGGTMVDPLALDSMGDFRAQMELMLRQRRQDPGRWNILPFPIRYQALGGDAQQLAPRELLDQGVEIMLNAAGSPVQLYRSDLTVQAAPVALRLFESDNTNLVHDNNAMLRWAVQQTSQLLGWEPVGATMKRVTTSDDFQKQMSILQMVMGGMVSRSEGLKLLGLSFKDQQRLIAEEARFEQKMQAEIQEEMEQAAFGQQIAKGQVGPGAGAPGAAPAQGGDPAQQGAMPTGPVTGMLQSGNTPQTPEDMLAQADALATDLLSQPEQIRRSELNKLRQSHDALHGLVLKRMNQKRNQARSQGAAMILGQQQQQPPPQG